MDFDNNYIQYVVPADSIVKFDVLDSNVYIKLLSGVMTLNGQFFRIGDIKNLKEQKNVQLRIEAESVFDIYGNHEIREAYTNLIEGGTYHHLFHVRYSNNSHQFVIEKDVQLHLFFDKEEMAYLRKVNDNSNIVCITALEGKPQIFGSTLLLNTQYYLPSHLSVVVNSEEDRFTLKIEGNNLKTRISTPATSVSKCWTDMRDAHAFLQSLRASHEATQNMGPVVLVTGRPKVGKTSFCHYLVNKAVEEGSHPLYIHLDVYDNTNSVPGTLSMVAVEGQRDVEVGFPGNTEVLHFGSRDPFDNLGVYFLMVRQMGVWFRERIKDSRHLSSGAVIDMCSSLATRIEATECVLNAFKEIGYVFIISDENDYRDMRQSILKLEPSLHIKNILQNEAYGGEIGWRLEMLALNSRYKKYFFGSVKNPRTMHRITEKMSDVKIVIPNLLGRDTGRIIYEPNDNIERHNVFVVKPLDTQVDVVLGVSEGEDGQEGILLTRIKYFVVILYVDEHDKTITFRSPYRDSLRGRVLLMGNNRF